MNTNTNNDTVTNDSVACLQPGTPRRPRPHPTCKIGRLPAEVREMIKCLKTNKPTNRHITFYHLLSANTAFYHQKKDSFYYEHQRCQHTKHQQCQIPLLLGGTLA
ncbi:MAG: hypothetical protein ACXWDN_18530 [Limisphaerales bacterium]